MKSLYLFVACVALVALAAAPAPACDYGNGGNVFSLVQPQVYSQQLVVGGYSQALVQRQVVVRPQRFRQQVVVQQQVVRRPLLQVRAPFVSIGW